MAQKSYADEKVSGWAVGFVLFAGIMLITIGIFQAIVGFAAIIENEFYVVARNYAYEVDVTAWGWIHLILGIVVGIAGWGVMMGALWARIVGITVAVLSAIANFFFIPYYPFWSLLIIALDVFVIWALCVYGRKEAGRAVS
jgi:hypothetical protein